MKFEVIGTDGKVKMQTYDTACVYNFEQLISLEREGYSFRLGGTKVNEGSVASAQQVSETFGKVSPVKVDVVESISAAAEGIKDVMGHSVSIEGDTYKVEYNICKRVRKYDDVDKRSRNGFNTYEAAIAFLDEKQAKAGGYWAGGNVLSNTTGEVLRTNGY